MNEQQSTKTEKDSDIGKCMEITLKTALGGLIVVILGIGISAGLGDLLWDVIIITVFGLFIAAESAKEEKSGLWQGFCILVCLGGIIDFFTVIGLGRILFLIGYIVVSGIAVFCANKYDEKLYYKQACADISNQNNNFQNGMNNCISNNGNPNLYNQEEMNYYYPDNNTQTCYQNSNQRV